jgi:hypothetical protein
MSFWPAATLVIGLALGLGMMTVHLIPAAVRFGVPPVAADNLPFLGFFGGALAGVAAALSKSARNTLATAFSVFVFGAVLGLIGLLLEGVLVAADVDEASVSWVSPGAFCLGIAAGIFALSVGAVDEVKRFFNRVEQAPDRSDTRRQRR